MVQNFAPSSISFPQFAHIAIICLLYPSQDRLLYSSFLFIHIHSYTYMFIHVQAYSFIFMYMYTHSLLRDNTTSPSPGSSISFRNTVSEKKSLTSLLPEPRQVFLPGVHLPQPPRPFCLLPEPPGPLQPHQLRLLQQPPQLPQHPLPLLRSR